MVKILIADENIEQTKNFSQFLTNDKDFFVESANTGFSALNKYLEFKPNILILDSHFTDISYIEIIDRLCTIPLEKKKCNTILTINKPQDQLALKNTAKIYQIFNKPLDYNKLLETINLMKCEFKVEDLTLYELDFLLLHLNFNLKSNGTRYIESAIIQCYYYPTLLCSLDGIFNIIAKQYNTTSETVRDGMRSALNPLNNSRIYEHPHPLTKLFDINRNITPKYFLETIVTYLLMKKNKK